MIRPLSSAIWGCCKFCICNPTRAALILTSSLDDASTDPSRHDVDQKSMLSTADGTVNPMTGVDIHGPDAKLSSESPIEFNVAESMGMNASLPHPIPTFPDIVTPKDSKLLLPVPPGPNWEDDSKSIKTDWKDKEGVAQNVLATWTESIAAFSQWDTTASPLQATAPSETIKRFDDLYLNMPWLTAAAPTEVKALIGVGRKLTVTISQWRSKVGIGSNLILSIFLISCLFKLSDIRNKPAIFKLDLSQFLSPHSFGPMYLLTYLPTYLSKATVSKYIKMKIFHFSS